MEGGLFLDVVVSECAAVLKLLAGKDEALLIRWDALLILNLGLHVLNGVRGLNIEGDSLARQRLHEDLHARTTTETKHEVESRLLLNVVVSESATVLELLASEDEALLIRWDAFLVLDLGLHVLDRIGRLNIEGDGLARQRLHEDLHTRTATKAKNEVKGGLLLDVVVSESATILELLASEDEALLVRRNAFLVLNLGLHVLDRIGRLNIEGNGLARESLDEDLHTRTTTEAKHEVEGRLLLNVVVSQGRPSSSCLPAKMRRR